MVGLRALPPPLPSPFSFPFAPTTLFPLPSAFPPPSPLLLWFLSPLPSPFPSCAHRLVSTPVSIPVPTPSPLLPPFPSCVRSLASTPVPVPAPSPSPSPFPPPPPIPLPTPFDPSRLSDPVTPSIQCTCTNTTPCERICRVPAHLCACVYVCVSMKFHITTQSGSVILIILSTRIDPPKGISMTPWYFLRKPMIGATNRKHSLYLYIFLS